MLRTLFKSLAKDYASNDGYRQHSRSGSNTLVTIGRVKAKYKQTNDDVENGNSLAPDNDSNQELDNDSTRNIITVTREFETRSNHSGKEFEMGVIRAGA